MMFLFMTVATWFWYVMLATVWQKKWQQSAGVNKQSNHIFRLSFMKLVKDFWKFYFKITVVVGFWDHNLAKSTFFATCWALHIAALRLRNEKFTQWKPLRFRKALNFPIRTEYNSDFTTPENIFSKKKNTRGSRFFPTLMTKNNRLTFMVGKIPGRKKFSNNCCT